MLSDILPTGFECGVLNGRVKVGSSVAIVGSGPIGLAALLTAQFYSPAEIIMIDLDDNRLAVAKRFGATATVNSAGADAAQQVMKLTGERGVDTAIEAVGIPATFTLCEDIVAADGTIANVGVHGIKVDLHLERAVVAQRDHHHPAGRHGLDSNAAQDRAVQTHRCEAADHAPLQARPGLAGLRHGRQGRRHQGAEGDHRSVRRDQAKERDAPHLTP